MSFFDLNLFLYYKVEMLLCDIKLFFLNIHLRHLDCRIAQLKRELHDMKNPKGL